MVCPFLKIMLHSTVEIQMHFHITNSFKDEPTTCIKTSFLMLHLREMRELLIKPVQNCNTILYFAHFCKFLILLVLVTRNDI